MRYAFHDDSKAIFPVQAFKLSKLANISTGHMQCEAIFTDTIQSLLSYVQAFKDGVAPVLSVCAYWTL